MSKTCRRVSTELVMVPNELYFSELAQVLRPFDRSPLSNCQVQLQVEESDHVVASFIT